MSPRMSVMSQQQRPGLGWAGLSCTVQRRPVKSWMRSVCTCSKGPSNQNLRVWEVRG